MCSVPHSLAGSSSQPCDHLCMGRYAGHLWSETGPALWCEARPPLGRAQALLAASTLMLGDLAQLVGVRGSFGTGLLSGSLGQGEGLMPLHSDEQMSPAVAVPAQVLIRDVWATLWQPGAALLASASLVLAP